MVDSFAIHGGAPPTVDGPALYSFLNSVKTKFNRHTASDRGIIHYLQGPSIGAADATDLASAQTLATAIKNNLNNHLGEGVASAVHWATPTTAAVAAADATDEASTVTLCAELQTKWNLHVQDAYLGIAVLSQAQVDASNVTFS